MKCPQCRHKVEDHADFFCMRPNCYCNLPKSTVQAMAELKIIHEKFAITEQALSLIYNESGNEIAAQALAKVNDMELEYA